MTTLYDFYKTDLVDDHVAGDVNKLIATSLRAEHANTETISATKTLTDGDTPFQILTASGADRDVRLPASAVTNHPTIVYNAGASNSLVVKDNSGGTTFVTLATSEWALLISISGVAWKLAIYSNASGAITGSFAFNADISPSQITSNQNNYNPTGLSTASVLRLSSDASRNITGLSGGTDGRVIIIHNVGTNTIVLKDEDASSTAANRFALSADVTINADQSVMLQYDTTTQRWRMIGGTGSSSKGRAEILVATVPLTNGAPIAGLDGASSPAEGFAYREFVNGSITYVDFLCRLIGYTNGGLTLRFEVMRTSAGAAATYIFDAAIRRINTGTEDLGVSHTYDYNSVTVTIPAGPPNAGIPMAGTITFIDGADMDSLADNELFVLRFRRNGGTATDSARVLAGITIQET